ncbi:MAG: site-specific DNA-methyltransferase [Myxococcales bacterium]|nr:site-specific DNA-methyltransferase [Myxococcales bacterium]
MGEARMIHHADVLDALRAMPDNSFHGCLTDPPYGLSFMGHQWDHGVPSAEVWREVLRVLRPGAALLAFGGTRTFHRLTCAIEDAGFEVRDCMMWLYGSGFPKSHDVSKAIDREAGAKRELVCRERPDGKKTGHACTGFVSGATDAAVKRSDTALTEAARQWEGHGTALKPAWEPIILARKPLEGTVAANVQRWGCGALAIDASRVEGLAEKPGGKIRSVRHFDGHETGRADKDAPEPNPLGRWPANVILDEEAGAALDAQSGTLQARGNKTPSTSKNKKALGAVYGKYGPASSGPEYNRNDSGGASRFFKQCDYTEEDARFIYCAKASRKERDAGLEGFDLMATSRYGEQGQGPTPQQTPRKPVAQRNVHPTVKPLALTTYLARLILPPVEGSRLLVPFCGSGSEMLGGTRAGWSHVEGIDSWDVAVKIARARTA